MIKKNWIDYKFFLLNLNKVTCYDKAVGDGTAMASLVEPDPLPDPTRKTVWLHETRPWLCQILPTDNAPFFRSLYCACSQLLLPS